MTYREKSVPERAALWCPFNDGIDCGDPHCLYCGWNPTVTEQRISRLHIGAEARQRERIGELRDELRRVKAENCRLKLRLGENI